MLTTKLFKKDEDYKTIETFCNKRSLPLIEKDLLSDYGVLVLDGETPVVCGWLYPTLGSKLCLIENVISDKDVKDKDESLSLLFYTLHLIAKDMGYKYVKNSVENKSMKKRLESYGYMSLQDNVTNYMGVL